MVTSGKAEGPSGATLEAITSSKSPTDGLSESMLLMRSPCPMVEPFFAISLANMATPASAGFGAACRAAAALPRVSEGGLTRPSLGPESWPRFSPLPLPGLASSKSPTEGLSVRIFAKEACKFAGCFGFGSRTAIASVAEGPGLKSESAASAGSALSSSPKMSSKERV